MQSRDLQVEEAPSNGCYVYGLLMEGARWDSELNAINESFPKVLFDELPIMLLDPSFLDPSMVTEDVAQGVYPSPCYKTSERRVVLSTTGHSTNFIMTISLPIQVIHSEKYWVWRGVALLSQLDD